MTTKYLKTHNLIAEYLAFEEYKAIVDEEVMQALQEDEYYGNATVFSESETQVAVTEALPPIDLQFAYKEARRSYKAAKRAVKEGKLTAIEAQIAEKLHAKQMAKKHAKIGSSAAWSEASKAPKQLKRKAKESAVALSSVCQVVTTDLQPAQVVQPSSVESLLEILVDSKKTYVEEMAPHVDANPLSRIEELAVKKAKIDKKLESINIKKIRLEVMLASVAEKTVSATEIDMARESIISKQQKLTVKESALISMRSKIVYQEENLTSPQLGKAKHEAHKYFDLLCQKRAAFFNIKESKAKGDTYLWLSKMLKMPEREAHMSLMDVATCKKTAEICKITIGLWAQVTHETKSCDDKTLSAPKQKL